MIRMKTLSWFVFVLCALSATGKVFIAQVGHKIVLDCGVSTFQKILIWNHDKKLFWKHVQTIMMSKASGNEEIGLRSKVVRQTSLEITRVKEEDAGEFTCKADSALQQHTLVVVSVSVDPPGPLQQASEATLTCKVSGPSQSSTLEWQMPNGSKVQSETVHLKSVDVSHKGTWICKVTYEGEKFDANMNIDIQVPTTASTSQNPKTTLSSVGNSDHAVVLLGLNWWVWVAVGLGCLVVIVLIISVIATCKKVRRRKRRLQKMKNAQLQHKPKTYCQCESKTAAAKPQQGRRREKPSALPLQPLLKEGHDGRGEEREEQKTKE